MSRKRADRKNHVKSSLTDRTYDAMQRYMELHGIDTESAAVARILDLALLGMVGSIPEMLIEHTPSNNGTKRIAA
ncbi:hypothetical protein [Chromobacterium subtsugae]|uniref:hypothetical protein n=1 Tax=Chromobacterium subtsugae TaxID=251747 RepID=UPI0008051E8C|nr:hypothetical protein [Chromobacterium subtsugae]OBU84569.1 hypothetical protein MY55_21290 [Chromobacterium subtsugae]